MNTKISKTLLRTMAILIMAGSFGSCKKFLDEKPDSSLGEPKSIEDLQAIMDSYSGNNSSYPNLGQQSDDDYYLVDAYLNGLNALLQATYKWDKNIETDATWRAGYKVVLNSNMVLEILPSLQNSSQQLQLKTLKGTALFFRSLAFFHLAQHFALPYNQTDAATLPGIPLRLASDVNAPVHRHTMQQTYEQIIQDLNIAVAHLPALNAPLSRPSKQAAYALFANLYLSMENYNKAGLYADSALQLGAQLINYNTVSTSAAIPFAQFNNETIMSIAMSGHARFNPTNGKVDAVFYNSYSNNDLRKKIFFRAAGTPGQFAFKGNYQGNTTGNLFCGFTTAEMLLVRAEASARQNAKDSAMADINRLLKNRIEAASFTN
ncbi:MAG: hypothetical protein EOP51_17685, partial [Sphingobacteriales bacterium]